MAIDHESKLRSYMQSTSEFESLDPNMVPAERMGAWILICVLSIIGIVVWTLLACLVFGLGDWKLWTIGFGIVGLVCVIGWLSMIEPIWRLRSTRLREVQNGLELHRGYIWHHRIFVPRERIQHTDIVQGPISRRFGVASLVINTAGTHNHQITIEGLAKERAEQLRLSLLPRTNDNRPLQANGDEKAPETRDEFVTVAEVPESSSEPVGDVAKKEEPNMNDGNGSVSVDRTESTETTSPKEEGQPTGSSL
jgi:uncharacterized protein